MARSDFCPTCEARVKIPDQAKRGMFIRCPACEETFQPKFLRPIEAVDEDREPYDPHTAEGYGVKGETARSMKKDQLKEVRKEIQHERRQSKWKKQRRGLFEGVEGVLLIFAIGSACLLPILVYGSKYLSEKYPNAGMMMGLGLPTFFIIAVVAIRLRRAGYFANQ